MHFSENFLKSENQNNLNNEWFKLWYNVVENNFNNINQNLNNLMKFHFEMESSDTHPNFSWSIKYVPSLINNYCKNISVKGQKTLNILGVAALFADNKTFESVVDFITNNINLIDYFLYNSELNNYLFFQRVLLEDNSFLLEKYYNNHNEHGNPIIDLTFKDALLNNYFLQKNYPVKCIGFFVQSDWVKNFLGVKNKNFRLLDFLVEQKDKDNILNFLDYYPHYNAYTQGVDYIIEGNIDKLKFLSETLDSMRDFQKCPLLIRAINTFNDQEIKEENRSFIYNLNDVFDIPYFVNQINKNFDDLKMHLLAKRKDQQEYIDLYHIIKNNKEKKSIEGNNIKRKINKPSKVL